MENYVKLDVFWAVLSKLFKLNVRLIQKNRAIRKSIWAQDKTWFWIGINKPLIRCFLNKVLTKLISHHLFLSFSAAKRCYLHDICYKSFSNSCVVHYQYLAASTFLIQCPKILFKSGTSVAILRMSWITENKWIIFPLSQKKIELTESSHLCFPHCILLPENGEKKIYSETVMFPRGIAAQLSRDLSFCNLSCCQKTLFFHDFGYGWLSIKSLTLLWFVNISWLINDFFPSVRPLLHS